MEEINVMELFAAIGRAKKKAIETGEDQNVKLSDHVKKAEFKEEGGELR